MPLDIMSQRKRKNHSPASRRRMLTVVMAILAAINAGCSSSAQPKAAAPAEVSVAEVHMQAIGRQ